jgi:hypothetical protein
MTTTETDALGRFELPAQVPARDTSIYLIEVDGLYFDEALDRISIEPLHLRALYRLDETEDVTPAHVNLVTHLASLRTWTLIQQNVDFESAVDQAEDELFAYLGLVPPSLEPFVPGTAMSLVDGAPASSAYLILLDAVLDRVAVDEGGGEPDTELQDLVDELADDLGDDGALESGPSQAIAVAMGDVSLEGITSALEAYLGRLGVTATLPALEAYIDRDRDGVADENDDCPLDPDSGQTDTDGDGLGDACDECDDVACMPGLDR